MSEEQNLLIDAFLAGTLAANEQALFLKRMEEDTTFSNQVNLEKQLRQTLNKDDWSYIKNTEHIEVKSYEKLFASPKTKALENTIKNIAKNKSKSTKSKTFIWYSMAAILVVSLSIFSVFNTGNTSEELYADYFNPSDLPSLIVRGATEKDNFNTAQQLFENKKYQETIRFIEDSLPNPKKNAATIFLYKGISYTETAQYEKAVINYNALIKGNLLDNQKGYWFKALTYLKADNIEDAKKTLQLIIENKYYNYAKATSLLNKLARFK